MWQRLILAGNEARTARSNLAAGLAKEGKETMASRACIYQRLLGIFNALDGLGLDSARSHSVRIVPTTSNEYR